MYLKLLLIKLLLPKNLCSFFNVQSKKCINTFRKNPYGIHGLNYDILVLKFRNNKGQKLKYHCFSKWYDYIFTANGVKSVMN